MSTTAQLLVGGERTSGESIRSQNGKPLTCIEWNINSYLLIFSDGCDVSGEYRQNFSWAGGSGQDARR